MKKIFVICALFALSGCAGFVTKDTPIGQLTMADAKAASALATASNDAVAAKCYDYISNGISNAPNFTPGLLYLNEVKRTAAASSQNLAAACGGVLPLVIAP